MRILIAYDGSECAEAALDDLTRAGLPHRAETLVFGVVELWLPPPHPESYLLLPDPSQEPVVEEANKLALRAVERLKKNFPEWTVNAKVERGSPASEILNFAEDWQPDLIVVGSHGRSVVGRLVLGSVSQKVVTEARCSVRVARGKVDVEPAAVRLIVGVDGGPGSENALTAIASREWPKGSAVQVVGVHEPLKPSIVGKLVPVVSKWLDETNTEETSWITTEMDKASERLRATGLSVTSILLEGDPRSALVETAREWDADSIFVGATGHLGRARSFLLGSVSAAVTARAHCSVEVVRTSVRDEPVNAMK
ncbi:MAG TPA: universal stress protein [Pyrinomonadaceae bacterium]|nr:universal stress protein [Pyrinomonadaceae bacterium]